MTWHSLFMPTETRERTVDVLTALYAEHGYVSYDPFPGGTGTPPGLATLVRLFAAPPRGGWLRILGAPDAALLADFSARVEIPVVYGWLTEQDGSFALFRDGQRYDDPAAFGGLLTDKISPALLRQAFEGRLPVRAVDPEAPSTVVLGADALPPEIAQLAEQQGVDVRKASKLFDRLGGSVLAKLGPGAEQVGARALLAGGQDLWNSLDGQRVRAIAGVLALPDDWRLPGWEAVRDAYQVHRLRLRSPRLALMPGDREALTTVPDIADYLPIYLGRT